MTIVGIFGGGQLAMMLAQAARRLGLQTRVLAPDADCPASKYADGFEQQAYEDLPVVHRFAETCDVVTFEFENIPVRSLFHLTRAGFKVAPGPNVLEIIQDRLTEKQFLTEIGVAPARFARIDKQSDFGPSIARLGLPAVLKTRHFGYDGKGQTWIREPDQAAAALDLIHHHPAVLEAAIPFVRKFSVIAARSETGEFVSFPPTENRHQDGILQTSSLPAGCTKKIAQQAIATTRKIADRLDYVGVLAVEFFETENGQILVNEIAPRVHNSGHWTIEGASPDQFELHLRAICGLELLVPVCKPKVQMQNLIGDDIKRAGELRVEGWQITDYGKAHIRPGRKMGHAVKVG
jgi:5-(carboxyamino)imidazole ribonucleotide synthase